MPKAPRCARLPGWSYGSGARQWPPEALAGSWHTDGSDQLGKRCLLPGRPRDFDQSNQWLDILSPATRQFCIRVEEMGRKQSLTDRLNRFSQGCCPIHGLFMSQIDRWYYPKDGNPYTVVGCPRQNCDARAKAYSFDGPWHLLLECEYLLDENLDLSRLPANTQVIRKKRSPRITREAILAKTNGQCYYCGVRLDASNFTNDHVVPQVDGGEDHINNLVPSCKPCNSAKGAKHLEDFKFSRAMQRFQESTSVNFSLTQVQYLESIGVKLDIPIHRFWFETLIHSS